LIRGRRSNTARINAARANRDSRIAPVALVALVAWIGLVAVACGTTPSPSSPVTAAAAGSSTTAASLATSSMTAAASASAALMASPDPSLLSRVSATVAGIPLTYDPETTASVAADPGLGRDASALAIAIGVAPGDSSASQAGSSDVVVVSVVRARANSIADTWFRGYRDSYDAAACASAGGVSGHAQATMQGRTVFIGSCAGGALTYHVQLAGEPVIVSVTSVGPRRLGEKFMESIP
jgi:hypothetical protein